MVTADPEVLDVDQYYDFLSVVSNQSETVDFDDVLNDRRNFTVLKYRKFEK